jgi:hypothetical protein
MAQRYVCDVEFFSRVEKSSDFFGGKNTLQMTIRIKIEHAPFEPSSLVRLHHLHRHPRHRHGLHDRHDDRIGVHVVATRANSIRSLAWIVESCRPSAPRTFATGPAHSRQAIPSSLPPPRGPEMPLCRPLHGPGDLLERFPFLPWFFSPLALLLPVAQPSIVPGAAAVVRSVQRDGLARLRPSATEASFCSPRR